MRRKRKTRAKPIGQYKSTLEAKLHKMLPKGTKYEVDRLQYTVEHSYSPDFKVTTRDGRVIYIECKGYLRYEDQTKMRAVKNCNPLLDIRFYFPKLGRVGGSKLTNLAWCEKYGFPCYIGTIPKGALK